MADIGTAYVNIVPKAPGIKNNITNLLGGADGGAEKAGANLGRKLLGGLAKLGIGAAVGKMVKDAFDIGGQLQQSFGGLDTIYGDAAVQAKEYAQEAAKAGISANSYAEQAVSFGAALKQAYGGDTQAAMEAANLAILDMADNAAKMGTPLESIQNAYQGFAKQNYTMLDNLKLGYGGTKEEMERLLADAEAFSGVHYDISNLGDVYSAIHVVQEELGLAGVAAGEAKTTLTGSLGAVKASWENLMGAMTTGQGFGPALRNLSDSVSNFATNIIDMFGPLAAQLPGLILGLVDIIIDNAPEFVAAGTQMIVQLAVGLVKAIPQLVAKIPEIFGAFKASFKSVDWAGLGKDVINFIANALANFKETLKTKMKLALNHAKTAVTSVDWAGVGSSIISKIGNALTNLKESVKSKLKAVLSNAKSAINDIDWLSLGQNIIDGIISGIKNAGQQLFSSLKELAANALQAAKNVLNIGSPSRVFADEVGANIPAGIALGIDRNAEMVDNAVRSLSNVAAFDMPSFAPAPVDDRARSDADRIIAAIREMKLQVDVGLEGDARGLFRVVRNENRTRTMATNYNALAIKAGR
ncbi:MAG: hypothetical protein J6T26_01225 [Firmicutes bacterium]|nr:hypothetical protein [Bacillota bacterium]